VIGPIRSTRSRDSSHSASEIPAAIQRTIIAPSRQRLTLRVKRPMSPFMFSIVLVLRSVR
jgi:hypothetical protein